jgi:flagellar basal body rod protein FlgC
MILSDFLSRANIIDQEDPYDLIPIIFSASTPELQLTEQPFNTLEILQAKYDNPPVEIYDIITRAKAKQEGVKVDEVTGINKTLDPHFKPEHQHKSKKSTNQIPITNPLKTKTTHSDIRAKQASQKLLQKSRKILSKPLTQVKRQIIPTQLTDKRPIINPDVEYTIPSPKFIPNPIDPLDTSNIDPLIDLDGPMQEQTIDIIHKRPLQTQFEIPPSLEEQIDQSKIYVKQLPKQTDIDKVLKQINKKVLRQCHLTSSLKDLQAAYLGSLHFRDIFLYLKQNKLPVSKRKCRQIMSASDQYFILDMLLFKLHEKQREDLDTKTVYTNL